ncbi:hypothetical protein GTHT12_03158 [Geobacillus thermodenitrificans]|jgi:hypothetical protein|nr:hypothetical protein GTHT12_03158 [Geobacillus thermodenitrificans]KQB94939.1 hypothetical protein GEPA3_0086 [Geobacillus sp. PA-3]MEC5189587.1 hypothetical protein [Geobacillus thermodenitrificans]
MNLYPLYKGANVLYALILSMETGDMETAR